MKICAHSLVKNEEGYLWYSINSVIDYVDRVMIWDTGSTDRTLEIISELKNRFLEKVEVKKFSDVTAEKYTELRQKMLDETDEEWVMILDGDEVWWTSRFVQIKKVLELNKYESIVSRYVNPVGDIYHYSDEKYAKYNIHGHVGNYTIRLMNKNKIKGLYTSKPHGQHGYFDSEDKLVQERDKKNMYFSKTYDFMHFTHLVRSNSRESDKQVIKRGFKYRYELGEEFALNYYYPEVFFEERPEIVPNVWEKRDLNYEMRARVYLVPRKIKKLFNKGKVGY